IITRKDEGGEFNAFYSQPGDSGGEQLRLSASYGAETERGYFRVTGDYSRQEILQRGDRSFFDCNQDYVFDQTTGQRADLVDPRTNDYHCYDLPWGHVWVFGYAADYGDGPTHAGAPVFLMQFDRDGALAAIGLPPLATGPNPNWMTAPAGWMPVGQGDPLSDSLLDAEPAIQDLTTLVPEAELMTVFVEGEYQLTDNMTAYGEVLLNRRKTTDVAWRQIWTYVYNYDSADMGWESDPFSAGWTGAQWLSPLTLTEHSG